jgi:hypothetical protein
MAIRNLLNRGRAKFAENLRASPFYRDLQNETTLARSRWTVALRILLPKTRRPLLRHFWASTITLTISRP